MRSTAFVAHRVRLVKRRNIFKSLLRRWKKHILMKFFHFHSKHPFSPLLLKEQGNHTHTHTYTDMHRQPCTQRQPHTHTILSPTPQTFTPLGQPSFWHPIPPFPCSLWDLVLLVRQALTTLHSAALNYHSPTRN